MSKPTPQIADPTDLCPSRPRTRDSDRSRLGQALQQIAQVPTSERPAEKSPQMSPAVEPSPLLESDAVESQPANDSDRREYPRHDSSCIVAIARCPAHRNPTRQETDWMLHSTRLQGDVFDISMNGVAFLCEEDFEAGEQILMRLSKRRQDVEVDTDGEVLRTMPQSNGRWKVICRFLHDLSFDQLQQLGRPMFRAEFV